jgi:hypothetical protein
MIGVGRNVFSESLRTIGRRPPDLIRDNYEVSMKPNGALVSLVLIACACGQPALADVCDVANSTVAKVTGGAAAATAVTGSALTTLGIVTVAHSSGAAIATGAAGYVAGTLGSIGATALGVVTAPATIVAATATAAAIGGTLAYCYYYAPPEPPKTATAAPAKVVRSVPTSAPKKK